MATRTPKPLADGQLPITKTTLYTCPVSTKTYLSSIVAHNTNVAAQTVIFYVNKSGTSRVIARVTNLAQGERIHMGPGEILDAGDLLEGETTTASAVDYSVSGVEET